MAFQVSPKTMHQWAEYLNRESFLCAVGIVNNYEVEGIFAEAQKNFESWARYMPLKKIVGSCSGTTASGLKIREKILDLLNTQEKPLAGYSVEDIFDPIYAEERRNPQQTARYQRLMEKADFMNEMTDQWLKESAASTIDFGLTPFLEHYYLNWVEKADVSKIERILEHAYTEVPDIFINVLSVMTSPLVLTQKKDQAQSCLDLLENNNAIAHRFNDILTREETVMNNVIQRKGGEKEMRVWRNLLRLHFKFDIENLLTQHRDEFIRLPPRIKALLEEQLKRRRAYIDAALAPPNPAKDDFKS